MKHLQLILIIWAMFLSSNAYALEGGITYQEALIDYSNLTTSTIMRKADMFLHLAEKCTDKTERNKYYGIAAFHYNIASKIEPLNIKPCIYLGHIHGKLGNFNLAKSYFYRAANINKDNPELNHLFGEFYFNEKMYQKALPYFISAYQHGYQNNENLNLILAMTYEKLADIENAKKYYNNVLRLNPKNSKIKSKINLLDELKYDKRGYYIMQY